MSERQDNSHFAHSQIGQGGAQPWRRRQPMPWLASLFTVAVICVLATSGAEAQIEHIAAATDTPANEPATMPTLADVFNVIDQATGNDEGQENWSAPIRLAMGFMLLALLPSLLVMMTSFTRIVIVLAFVRRALTTQSIPPNMAIIGLALFLTLFTMAPTLTLINDKALQPYLNEELTMNAAVERAGNVLKAFMLRQTRHSDLQLFANLADMGEIEALADVPIHVVVPAFAISEFRTAFEMGALLFIPFLLVDLVIAGILLSAGMMMLPPAMISLPFKIVLFVLVDGWTLLAQALVMSFH